MPMLFNSSSLAILLAFMAPSVALCSVNTSLFSRRQIRNSIILMALAGALCGALFHIADTAFLSPLSGQLTGDTTLGGALIGTALALGIFFFLSERTFSELLEPRTRLATMGIISLLFLGLAWLVSPAVLSGILAGYIGLSFLDLRKNYGEDDNEFAPADEGEAEDDAVMELAGFIHKPNVYVLFLESLHSAEALRALYDIDAGKMCSHLHENGFTLYDNCCSNHTKTGQSFSSMVWPRNLYNPLQYAEMRELPPSRIFETFKSNGYRTNLFSSDYLKSRFAALFDTAVADSSSIGSAANQMFAPVLAQSAVLRKVFGASDIFEHVGDFDASFGDLHRAVRENRDVPQLHWFHFGAGHSPQLSWEEVEGFGREYTAMFHRAEAQLEQTVDMIMKEDPDPLIIAVGDHGATRYRFMEAGGDNPNDVIRSKGFEPDLIAMDLCSVFLGIRWPVSHFTNGQVVSHVRIFDHVIAALSGDEQWLDNMMPNISLYNCQYGTVVLARKGKPLSDWEQVSGENQLAFYIEEARANPDDLYTQLALVSKCFALGQEDLAMKFLIPMGGKFQDSEEVNVKLARGYLNRADRHKAREHANAVLRINPRSSMALHYLGVIADQEGETEQSKQFVAKALECADGQLMPRDAYIRHAHGSGDNDLVRDMVLATSHDRQWLITDLSWREQFVAYRAGDTDGVLAWLNERIEAANTQKSKIDAQSKKLIILADSEQWGRAEAMAAGMVAQHRLHMGAAIIHARAQEEQGKVMEALQALISGFSRTNSEVLMAQLGHLANRHKLHSPELAPVKVFGREQVAAQLPGLADIGFDPGWFVRQYGHLAGAKKPMECYIQSCLGLMLNPNDSFDTAYYLSSHTEVFQLGVDAALHYARFGCNDIRSPRSTCLPGGWTAAEERPQPKVATI